MITRIGPHSLTCASATDPAVDEMLKGVSARVLYSDPPWSDGNLRYWATMNRKMTGREVAPISYEALLARLNGLIRRYVKGHVFVECGIGAVELVARSLHQSLSHVRSFELRYKSGSKILPNALVYGVNNGVTPAAVDPSGMMGPSVPEYCIRNTVSAGDAVIDPFCGTGYTARAAVAAGCAFYGNELNEARLRKTADFLSRVVE